MFHRAGPVQDGGWGTQFVGLGSSKLVSYTYCSRRRCSMGVRRIRFATHYDFDIHFTLLPYPVFSERLILFYYFFKYFQSIFIPQHEKKHKKKKSKDKDRGDYSEKSERKEKKHKNKKSKSDKKSSNPQQDLLAPTTATGFNYEEYDSI